MTSSNDELRSQGAGRQAQAQRGRESFGAFPPATTVPPEAFALAAAVREFSDTTAVVDLPPEELMAISERVRTLTHRLSAQERPDPIWFVSHEDGEMEHLTQAATGRLNPYALDATWLTPQGVETPVPAPDVETGETLARCTFARAHAAGLDRVDAGPIAALLDHTISFTTAAVDRGGFTVALELRFHAPTPYETPVLVRSRYTHSEGRKHFATGELVVDGQVTASAMGVFVTTAAPAS